MRRFTELRPGSMRFLERARPSMPNGVPMAWMATLYQPGDRGRARKRRRLHRHRRQQLSRLQPCSTGVVVPAEGFHSGLRRLASQSGALLAVDETHTLVAGPGGLTARWARAGHARDGQVHLGRHSARGLRDDHRSGPACSSPDRRRPLPTWWRPAARSLPTPWRWPRLASRSPRFSPLARLRARCRARRAAGRRHRGRHRSARPPLARPPRAWAAAWTSSRRLANPQSVARRKVGGHTPPRAPPGRSRSVSPARRRAWLKRGPSSQLEIVRGAGLATDLARPHTNGLQPEGAGR